MTVDVADSVANFEQEALDPNLESIKFSADSALIRELGERLVGQPYTALAELVKNAYDADATLCVVKLEQNRITVSDNGHGMNKTDFDQHWMKIGTRNKQSASFSRRFGRPTTGSKGVGRLSAQFLAHRMQLVTTSEEDEGTRLHALVDWDSAVTAGLLTRAEALYKPEPSGLSRYPGDSKLGTTVVMEGLKQSWTNEAVRQLGRQIWGLQSPFTNFGRLSTGEQDERAFHIEFASDRPGLDEAFAQQMRAIVSSWHAIIKGKVVHEGDRHYVEVDLRFADDERHSQRWPIDIGLDGAQRDWVVNDASWQINIYDFIGRQPGGVPVGDARKYLERFGGVAIYDSGFKLPYYGAENDWLGIEYAHAHRRSTSDLLPARLQVTRALNDLPTQGRILGVVSINTGAEFSAASEQHRTSGEYLKILITRDRLATNDAFEQLVAAVRSSIDYYATRQRIRSDREIEIVRPIEPSLSKVSRLRGLTATASAKFPHDETVQAVAREVVDLEDTIAKEAVADASERSLLGSLASTGMAALALEHENRKEIRLGRQLVRRLYRLAAKSTTTELSELATDLEQWLGRLESTREIFAPMLSPSDRDEVDSFRVASVVEQVARSSAPLMPQVDFRNSVPGDAYFPPATYADWHALIQNVLVNASNAMLDTDQPQVLFDFGRNGRANWLRIINNGVPIDLAEAERFFEPFKRRQTITSERAALGLGGMGLGLTIVRMIANLRRCNVRFVQGDGRTTFQLSWSSE